LRERLKNLAAIAAKRPACVNKIATDNSVNLSGASVKNKLAVDRVAGSKPGDKSGFLGTNESGGR
jgi:hypothetical protein